MNKAIITLLIGEKIKIRWQKNCQRSWINYCKRHGYELICLYDALDNSDRATRRSPAWQKCLVFCLPDIRTYDRVVWIDSDIIISEQAPDVLDENIPLEKIGAVDVFALSGNSNSARSYYQNAGLPTVSEKVVNTGVLVVSPKLHGKQFEDVYLNYEDSIYSFYEMIPLSYELIQRRMVHWIDPRFNHLVYDVFSHSYPFLLASNNTMSLKTKIKRKLIRSLFCRLCLEEALKKTYFLHFAGYGSFLEEKNYWGSII